MVLPCSDEFRLKDELSLDLKLRSVEAVDRYWSSGVRSEEYLSTLLGFCEPESADGDLNDKDGYVEGVEEVRSRGPDLCSSTLAECSHERLLRGPPDPLDLDGWLEFCSSPYSFLLKRS